MWDEVGHSATGPGLSNHLLVPGRPVLLSQQLLVWLLHSGSDVARPWLCYTRINNIFLTPSILQEQQLWHCFKASEKGGRHLGLRSRYTEGQDLGADDEGMGFEGNRWLEGLDVPARLCGS